MTHTPTHPDEASGTASRQGRRRRVVVASLLLALAAGWWLAASSAAREVSVAWAGPPACVGAKYAPVRKLGPPPAIHARRGFRCTITVVVHNGGFLPVHLDRLVAPYVGRGRGGGSTASGGPGSRSPLPTTWCSSRSVPARGARRRSRASWLDDGGRFGRRREVE